MVCGSGDRLFHKMGEGQGFGQHQGCELENVYVEKYRHKVWSSPSTCVHCSLIVRFFGIIVVALGYTTDIQLLHTLRVMGKPK